jgi:sugar phosphate isomerase/epimerase
MHAVPWRVGATSYVVEADLVDNAAYLAGKVQDMQLVLFDLPGGPCNVPSPSEVAALAQIGAAHDLSYTVHLTHDLDPPATDAALTHALAKAHTVIAATQPLQPWAYVLHLDARDLRGAHYPPQATAEWVAGMARSLARLAAWAGSATRLAVENLEGYPPGLVTPAVVTADAGRCVDVGHLWLDGHDPQPWLAEAGTRLRVLHLHGLDAAADDHADHRSLDLVDSMALDAVVAQLLAMRFAGVLTLEVFGLDDFAQSRAALEASMARCMAPTPYSIGARPNG